ncbi:hypothetical protein [Noviherbaspirillum saxi]|uniref:Uncharacterized protein n=1 Tax=Noviherbaspirillum saxi TaxID=2320863 RepID=A0A3A3G6D2_9BURK|nr:hypothetical protein [Noviherbaspirillum saxi]RJF95740.1 hypothetical protein D3871_20385 [Noviherbaspirillum saxi]
MRTSATAGFLSLLVLISGCVTPPFRSTLEDPLTAIDCPTLTAHEKPECENITPEISHGNYELHFVEFDDQGWDYRIRAATDDREGQVPPYGYNRISKRNSDSSKEIPPYGYSQIDHLIDRLTQLLNSQEANGQKPELNIILYVHGWNHLAKSDDEDVMLFRQVLQLQSRMEQNLVDEKKRQYPRKVIGIFVGWEGKQLDISPYALVPTFWSRKAAALRVSRGSVLELFSRLQTIQDYYNGPTESPDCRAQAKPMDSSNSSKENCRIRSLMVGHSFGAWILYSALSGTMIETLHTGRNLNLKEDEKKRYLKRPADLVVLINPAFEAVRYEPLHLAAMAYDSEEIQTPMLITITSTADMMTRTLFPVGRFINTFFEGANSDHQSKAMTRAHGHHPRHFTHSLTAMRGTCPGWLYLPSLVTQIEHPDICKQEDLQKCIKNNADFEIENAMKFYENKRSETGGLNPGWSREFCGDTVLTHYQENSHDNKNPNSPVWNIRTDKSLIDGHSDLATPGLLEFIRQVYNDTILKIR